MGVVCLALWFERTVRGPRRIILKNFLRLVGLVRFYPCIFFTQNTGSERVSGKFVSLRTRTPSPKLLDRF
jgi:hypothetical protein